MADSPGGREAEEWAALTAAGGAGMADGPGGSEVEDRAALRAAVGAAMADLQAAYDDRDRALAEALGVNRTDLRCLDLVVRGGAQTATELGARLHLTRGSMTTLIDRLENAGYVQRRADPAHGRRKLITPTARLADVLTPLLGPAIEQGHARLSKYDDSELRLILGFLRDTLSGQGAVTAAIHGHGAQARPHQGAGGSGH